MKAYRRVLAVVDVNHRGREAARHAWTIAQAQGARFGLGHVADWGRDLDCDDYSPLAPSQVEERLEVVVRRMLSRMAAQIGVPDASVAVSFSGAGRGIGELVRGWQPDLVVVAADDAHGLAGQSRLEVPGWSCDAVALDLPAFGLLPRVVRRITGLLSSNPDFSS